MKARARQLGLSLPGDTGPHNAISDVPGLKVGYSTITDIPKDPSLPKIQTGVTAILPRGHNPVPAYLWAGQHTLNGNGEMTGCHWINDAGYFISPICITNTHSIGAVHHATTQWMIERYPDFFAQKSSFVMPVIAETCDAILNDINGLHVKENHVFEALNKAKSGPIAEGNVGGGNGMTTYEFKGGTGTSSRCINLNGEDFTVGVLVQSNFGIRKDLTILGVPVGKHMTEDTFLEELQLGEFGSIIVIIATDIPLIPTQLTRVAKRASLGIARTGTIGGHSSGDIFLAFTTANAIEKGERLSEVAFHKQKIDVLDDSYLDDVYRAARDAVEEAVINAMLAAETSNSHKYPGLIVRALDHDALGAVMDKYTLR